MNMNEVLASLAARRRRRGAPQRPRQRQPVQQRHLPDRRSTWPRRSPCADDLLPALDTSRRRSRPRRRSSPDLVKSGRTHLMDATPVMLGQEFGGYAATVRLRASSGSTSMLPRVRELPLGGTAVGTGINTPPGFAARGDRGARRRDRRSPSPRPATTSRPRAPATRWSSFSGVLRTVAVGLTKICNDLRWMSSGPTTGLAEIHLPDLQPGSSIMPGKVNPVLPEATLMVCAQVIGNDATIAWAGASRQLRAQRDDAGDRPQPARVDAHPRHRLDDCSPSGASTASPPTPTGCAPTPSRRRRSSRRSTSYIGYEEAAKIAKQAMADGATIRETVLAHGLRRARRAHRGAARRGPRRGRHDPPVTRSRRPRLRARAVRRRGEPPDARSRIWQPSADGRDPMTEALAAVERALPGGTGDVLEVGLRHRRRWPSGSPHVPGVRLVAVDFSPLRRADGRPRGRRPAGRHPVPPLRRRLLRRRLRGWMLYHVPDLDRGLAEIRRVHRPGGTLRRGHQRGRPPGRPAAARPAGSPRSPASAARTARTPCSGRFDDVRRQDLVTRAVFTDHAAAQTYLDSFGEELRRDGCRPSTARGSTPATSRCSRPAEASVPAVALLEAPGAARGAVAVLAM